MDHVWREGRCAKREQHRVSFFLLPPPPAAGGQLGSEFHASENYCRNSLGKPRSTDISYTRENTCNASRKDSHLENSGRAGGLTFRFTCASKKYAPSTLQHAHVQCWQSFLLHIVLRAALLLIQIKKIWGTFQGVSWDCLNFVLVSIT